MTVLYTLKFIVRKQLSLCVMLLTSLWVSHPVHWMHSDWQTPLHLSPVMRHGKMTQEWYVHACTEIRAWMWVLHHTDLNTKENECSVSYPPTDHEVRASDLTCNSTLNGLHPSPAPRLLPAFQQCKGEMGDEITWHQCVGGPATLNYAQFTIRHY